MAGCIWTIVKVLWYIVREIFRKVCRKEREPDYSPDIVLVTGAAKGLGRALASQFAEYGATLVLWDVNEEALRSLCEELNEKNQEAFAYVVDCSKREEVYRAAEKVREEVGDVSVLVNNAGVLSARNFLDLTDEQIEKTFNVNTLGYIWTIRSFLPWMLENDYGKIVLVSSSAAISPVPKATDYCASKAAILGFAYALHLELLLSNKRGVTITTVCPGRMDNTGMGAIQLFPWPSVNTGLCPKDVAKSVAVAAANGTFILMIEKGLRTDYIKKCVLPVPVADELFLCKNRHHLNKSKKTESKKTKMKKN